MTEVGQSYERRGYPGSLYTVVHIERRFAAFFRRQAWYVTVMSVVPPVGWAEHPGRRFNEIVDPLDLRTYGYSQVG